jgi:intein/homing endonuclease
MKLRKGSSIKKKGKSTKADSPSQPQPKRKAKLLPATEYEFDPLQELLQTGGGHVLDVPESDDDLLALTPNPTTSEDDEFDVMATLEQALNTTSLVAPDLKIDDSSLPEAPNVLEWLLDKNFLGCETPYLEQALICVKMFAEYCVAKGSYIYTSEGMMRIEDAVGNPETKGMNPVRFNTVGLSGINAATYGGLTSKRRRCLKITYANGKSITVTPNHQVLVLNNNYTFSWIQADRLQKNDVGVSRLGSNLFNDQPARIPNFEYSQHKNNNPIIIPTEVTDELARFIGYVISDGTIDQNSVRFCSLDGSTLADDFAYCVEKVFGLKPKIERNKWKENSLNPYTGVGVHSRVLVKFLEHLGLKGKSYDKTIPDCILKSTREHNIECLRAIMDCDGWTDHKVGIVASCPELVKQIQLIMDNLGIYGKYREFYSNSSKISHREEGDRRSLRGEWVSRSPKSLYAEIIGTKNALRSEILCSHVDKEKRSSDQGNYRPGVVPFGKDLFAYSSTLRDSYHEKGLNYSTYGRRESFVIQSALDDEAFCDFWEEKDCRIIDRLEKIQENDLAFSRIISIEDAGIHEVYDITVPEGENFSCDGMIVHNCPHCSDTEWMDPENHEPQEGISGILDHVVMLEDGICPECGSRRSDMIKSGELNYYNELAVNAGQRSGKSIVTAMASTYITHRILKMQKPAEVFNIGKGTILHGTFVALTQGQAKDTLWEPYYGYLLESPWFKKYHDLLRHYEKVYRQEIFKLRDTFVLYRHRNLYVYPAGPDKRVLRGRTRIFGAIDEIGWFDNNKNSDKVKINAEEVYVALVRSLATLRSQEDRLNNIGYDKAITAYMLNISSPSSIRDKICELVRQSINSVKTLGVHLPTWKMNPNIPRNSSFLLEEERKDPITFMRDYGAEPPLSANAFINNRTLVAEACNKEYRNLVKYQLKIQQIGKEKYRYAEIDKIKPSTKPSIMAIDAGHTNNSFAVTVGTLDENGVPRTDCVVEILPLPGIPLSYPLIYEEVMKPLIEARNVKILLADRWNSIKILQDTEMEYADRELQQRQYSLKYSDMWSLKTAFEQFLFRIPGLGKNSDKIVEEVLKETLEEYPHCFAHRPVEHLVLQILSVQDTGKQVIKGEGDLTDDIWRSLALLYWGLSQEEYIEILLQPENVQELPDKFMGTVRLGANQGSGAPANAGLINTAGGSVLGMSMQRK